MVRAGVVGSWAVMGWWDLDMNHQGSVGLALRQGTEDDVLGLVFGQPKREEEQLGSYFRKGVKGEVLCPFSLTACAGFSKAAVEMDTRQKDNEKEREKDVPPGERTPKDRTWNVVMERCREDSSHGKMCGEWVIVDRCELGTVSGQLNSARWRVMVRAGVVGSWAVMGWWDLDMNHQGSVGLGLRQGTQDDVMGLVFGQPKGEKSSWAVISEKWKDQAVEMDTRQRDKEKEKEKDVPPWEITPKIHPFFSLLLNLLSIMLCDVIGLMETGNAEPRPWPVQRLSLRPCRAVLWSDLISRDRTWTVVKERCREDSCQGKMCGEWVIVDRCEVLITYCANCELMID
ncbi:hypothetical protein F2Q69_00047795 [Brassica cretica]|uniref:Uncharacterized protein n=1 Tax=Brassica cretica TaxID=69181 RepID=A0A8S9PVD6_BRACR|nr:hypothetical protein F2Q69_00047795 [Brassica cretica]